MTTSRLEQLRQFLDSRFVQTIGAIVFVVLAALAIGIRTHHEHSKQYEFSAIFDAARGIGAGQVVKVAGARVGTVEDVKLTDDFKARVIMRIDHRFGPFRADASCAIKPEGLVTENFIDCKPGTPSASPLKDDTVPVDRTAAPVTLSDLFKVFDVPTPQRLSVLLNELGISTAGRGQDINAILYRANPTLRDARKVIDIVNGQRRQLLDLLDAAAPVLHTLAKRDKDVERFIVQTRRLTETTAGHRDQLAEAIKRLPPLLAAARPALEELGTAAAAAPPTLRGLRQAAPALTKLTRDIIPLANEGVKTTQAFNQPLRSATTTLRRARPVLRLLNRFAISADPAGRDLVRFLSDLRDAGAFESILHLYYGIAGATNRYDAVSHLLTFNGQLSASCSTYQYVQVPGCVSRLDGVDRSISGAGGPTKAKRKQDRGSDKQQPDTGATQSTPTATATPDLPKALGPLKLPQIKLPKIPKLTLPKLPQLTPTPSTGSSDDSGLGGLLDFLMGKQ